MRIRRIPFLKLLQYFLHLIKCLNTEPLRLNRARLWRDLFRFWFSEKSVCIRALLFVYSARFMRDTIEILSDVSGSLFETIELFAEAVMPRK